MYGKTHLNNAQASPMNNATNNTVLRADRSVPGHQPNSSPRICSYTHGCPNLCIILFSLLCHGYLFHLLNYRSRVLIFYWKYMRNFQCWENGTLKTSWSLNNDRGEIVCYVP